MPSIHCNTNSANDKTLRHKPSSDGRSHCDSNETAAPKPKGDPKHSQLRPTTTTKTSQWTRLGCSSNKHNLQQQQQQQRIQQQQQYQKQQLQQHRQEQQQRNLEQQLKQKKLLLQAQSDSQWAASFNTTKQFSNCYPCPEEVVQQTTEEDSRVLLCELEVVNKLSLFDFASSSTATEPKPVVKSVPEAEAKKARKLMTLQKAETDKADGWMRLQKTEAVETDELMAVQEDESEETDELIAVQEDESEETDELVAVQETQTEKAGGWMTQQEAETKETVELIAVQETQTEKVDRWMRLQEAETKEIDELIAVQEAKAEKAGGWMTQQEAETKETDELIAVQETQTEKVDRWMRLQVAETKETDELIAVQETQTEKVDRWMRLQVAETKETDELIAVQEAEVEKAERWMRLQEAETEKTDELMAVQEAEVEKANELLTQYPDVADAEEIYYDKMSVKSVQEASEKEIIVPAMSPQKRLNAAIQLTAAKMLESKAERALSTKPSGESANVRQQQQHDDNPSGTVAQTDGKAVVLGSPSAAQLVLDTGKIHPAAEDNQHIADDMESAVLPTKSSWYVNFMRESKNKERFASRVFGSLPTDHQALYKKRLLVLVSYDVKQMFSYHAPTVTKIARLTQCLVRLRRSILNKRISGTTSWLRYVQVDIHGDRQISVEVCDRLLREKFVCFSDRRIREQDSAAASAASAVHSESSTIAAAVSLISQRSLLATVKVSANSNWASFLWEEQELAAAELPPTASWRVALVQP